MADPRPTALSLFSGVGGLDLGWELVTGGRVVGYCERDAYAAATLLARMEDASLDPAPIWCGDVADLDLAPFLGVDYVTGGFPCQDISVAGKGEGIEGERSGLWSELLRAYRDSGARYLFAENVSAITARGLDRVLYDLAEVGCTAEWLCLRASEVGAPHRRERWFLLAERDVANPARTEPRTRPRAGRGVCEASASMGVSDPLGDSLRHEPGRRAGPDGAGAAEPGYDGAGDVADRTRGGLGEHGGTSGGAGHIDQRDAVLADGHIDGLEGQRRGGLLDGQRAAQRDDVDGRVSGLADPDLQRRHGAEGARREAGRRAELAGDDVEHPERPRPQGTGYPGAQWLAFPPHPGDAPGWHAALADHPHLAPAIKPGLRRVADGAALVVDAFRADQLRCLGNGVVALQAAVALRELQRRLAGS